MTGLAGLFSNRYAFDDIPDQRGKTALVTGGTSGIGASIAAGLATAGAKVYIVGATEEHAKQTADSINAKVQQNSTGSPKFPSGEVVYKILDLGDLNAVEAFAQEMMHELRIQTDEQGIPEMGMGSKGREKGSKFGGLNLLVCNAGIGVAAPGVTKDGLQNHWAVNHLSHFLLTTSLLPLLQQTRDLPGAKDGDVRIVMQSSELHRTSPFKVSFETQEEVEDNSRDPNILILFAKELAKRVLTPAGDHILAIAVHPGGKPNNWETGGCLVQDTHRTFSLAPLAVATGQEAGLSEAYGLLGDALYAVSRVAFMSPDQGSESALWASTSPKVGQEPGKYQGAYLRQPDDSLGTESGQAKDEVLARNLWELSRKVVKDKTGKDVAY
ncbi:hypothetical protein QFC21_001510 [Naganishia friedmannii]|uniref:Uncharacterized protein n=1 Tax=Naganishia friedmannii TaxID=89922 RepID=A0ACC2W594_9TREE|nr:hypothetical protein QFC21_001510 [Naganishia friedmannii]